jgi:hypothetical protein
LAPLRRSWGIRERKSFGFSSSEGDLRMGKRSPTPTINPNVFAIEEASFSCATGEFVLVDRLPADR